MEIEFIPFPRGNTTHLRAASQLAPIKSLYSIFVNFLFNNLVANVLLKNSSSILFCFTSLAAIPSPNSKSGASAYSATLAYIKINWTEKEIFNLNPKEYLPIYCQLPCSPNIPYRGMSKNTHIACLQSYLFY